jgi:thiamine-phosphate pyrophosphorylase
MFKSGLYGIVDVDFLGDKDPIEIGRLLISSGAVALQLRAKKMEETALKNLSQALSRLCKKRHIPFIINDYINVALEIKDAGVHLGQEDTPISEARRTLGPKRLIGISCHTPDQALTAQAQGANYIGYGPIFPTSTKDTPWPPVGTHGLKDVLNYISLPVVAIGGINAENIEEVVATGVHAIAMISGLLEAPAKSEV